VPESDADGGNWAVAATGSAASNIVHTGIRVRHIGRVSKEGLAY
jgi:hypothetical protein